MARIKWAEVGGIAEQIIKGEHDADLEYIQIACKARLNRMFFKGQRIKLKETKSVELEGAVGRIDRVNQKSISITLDDGQMYNVPPRMLEVVKD